MTEPKITLPCPACGARTFHINNDHLKTYFQCSECGKLILLGNAEKKFKDRWQCRSHGLRSTSGECNFCEWPVKEEDL